MAYLFGFGSLYPWIYIILLLIDILVAMASHFSLPRLLLLCQILLAICLISIVFMSIIIVVSQDNNNTATSTTTTTSTAKPTSFNPAKWIPVLTLVLLIFHAIFWFMVNHRRMEISCSVKNDPHSPIGIPHPSMVYP